MGDLSSTSHSLRKCAKWFLMQKMLVQNVWLVVNQIQLESYFINQQYSPMWWKTWSFLREKFLVLLCLLKNLPQNKRLWTLPTTVDLDWLDTSTPTTSSSAGELPKVWNWAWLGSMR